ncbi:ATP-binding protein [Candidatus Woesearchaeota archaeon]|nr:ATP-binding protein [Candidatus Woesearchaeota archaeon]
MIKVAFAGGSCDGKTTLIRTMLARGIQTGSGQTKDYAAIDEIETKIRTGFVNDIGEEKTRALLRRSYFLVKWMVAEEQEKQETLIQTTNPEIVLLDRSAIDYIAMCEYRKKPIPENLLDLANKSALDLVLFFPVPPDFEDRVKKKKGMIMTLEDALQMTGIMYNKYNSIGYNPVFVPEFSSNKKQNIAMRVNFIEKTLKERFPNIYGPYSGQPK